MMKTIETHSFPGHLIRRLHQISTNIFMLRVKEAGCDLTPVQFAAMQALKASPDIDQAQIASLIAYDRATIGGVLKRLEKKGYIKRNKRLEYTLGQAKNLKEFQTNYLINQKNLSDFCTTLFNLMKNSKFKIT